MFGVSGSTRPSQHRALLHSARVYDVVGTSAGLAHKASGGIPGTPGHCPAGTSAPPLRGIDLGLERRPGHNRSGAVADARQQGNFAAVVGPGRRTGRQLAPPHAVSRRQPCAGSPPPSSALSTLCGSL